MRSCSSVKRHLDETNPGNGIGIDKVQTFLNALVANGFMISDGRHYLGLAFALKPNDQPETSVARDMVSTD